MARDYKVTSIILLATFKRENLPASAAAFAELYPHPFLLIERPEGEDFGPATFQTIATRPDPEEGEGARDPSEETASVLVKGGAFIIDPQGTPKPGNATYVCPLTKRDRNKFASLITIGRAANNDIRLNLPTVSKFHAYVTHVPASDAWFITDATSANGTFVDGKKLTGSARCRLENGSRVRIGPDVTARFFLAPAFYELVTRWVE